MVEVVGHPEDLPECLQGDVSKLGVACRPGKHLQP